MTSPGAPFVTALLAAAVGAGCSSAAPRALAPSSDEVEGVVVRARPDVATARDLDREGVRSYREGRFIDAIRYFRAAYRLGGPSSELWNIARSREKLDDPERAAAAIDEYLAQRDLSPQDRADAEREVRSLRARASPLTVTTRPAGALVRIDGRPVFGATPLSVEIPAGAHTVAVLRDGYAPQSLAVEARFGRAVVISLDLSRAPR